MESPQYAEVSVWEGVVKTLRMDPMVFVRETNWNVAQWIEEGGVFLDGELPYKVSDWQSSQGLHVEDPSAPLYLNGRGGDVILCLCVGLLLFALRLLLNQGVLFPLARHFGNNSLRKQLKFSEAAFFFIYYTPLFFWGLRLLLIHNFVFPFAQLYSSYPQRLHTFELKAYLTIQVGFYISAVLFLRYIDVRRKDFVQMTAHHFLTLTLIFLSSYYNFRNFTVVVMALHDFSDILLYLSKTLLYMGFPTLVQFSFGGFALSFFLSRILFFPQIIWSWHSVVLPSIDPDRTCRWDPTNEYYCDVFGRHRVTILMCLLYSMQLFWFSSIMGMVVDALRGDGTIRKDVRSDSDDDDGGSSCPDERKTK